MGGTMRGHADRNADTQRISDAQVEHRSGRLAGKTDDVEATRKQIFEAFPDVERQFQMICGTPKSVLPKIRTVA